MHANSGRIHPQVTKKGSELDDYKIGSQKDNDND